MIDEKYVIELENKVVYLEDKVDRLEFILNQIAYDLDVSGYSINTNNPDQYLRTMREGIANLLDNNVIYVHKIIRKNEQL